jgi:ribosomal-protein-alanine N-acetyltransferase
MNNISIEVMRRDHIPAILDIEGDVFNTPWTEEMFVQELEERMLSRAFVALEGSRLVGYMISWMLRQELHLINIAVTPGSQRAGIGTKMLRYLVDLAVGEGRRFITLEVRESNDAAIRLYESFGFKRIGVRPRYYREDGENAVVMVRFVPPDEGTEDNDGA